MYGPFVRPTISSGSRGSQCYAQALADTGCDSLAALHFLTESDLEEFAVKRIRKCMIFAKLNAVKTRRSPSGGAGPPSRPVVGNGSTVCLDDSPSPRKKRRSRGRKRHQLGGEAGLEAVSGDGGDRDTMKNFRSEFTSFTCVS